MSVSSSKYGHQDAEGQCARGSWLWRMLEAMKAAFPTPALTFADELRADRLLRANLTPEQRDQYGKDKSFIVVGGSTGRRYRITAARQMNVAALGNDGRWNKSLCIVPVCQLPLGDIMLAQKIALELFESEALRLANKAPPPFHRVGAF